jgi:hypothetical protein
VSSVSASASVSETRLTPHPYYQPLISIICVGKIKSGGGRRGQDAAQGGGAFSFVSPQSISRESGAFVKPYSTTMYQSHACDTTHDTHMTHITHSHTYTHTHTHLLTHTHTLTHTHLNHRAAATRARPAPTRCSRTSPPKQQRQPRMHAVASCLAA